MRCASCSKPTHGIPKGCKSNGSCSTGGCDKLPVFDWLANMTELNETNKCAIVQVRFKGTRKEFYNNTDKLSLHIGDIVVVEASQGFDIGVISLAGELVRLQIRRRQKNEVIDIMQKILRKATSKDIANWQKYQQREDELKIKTRELAKKHGLKMKISDVEFQGDGSKATFYYTADDRVDFRNLIKDMASLFGIRIEMRQIGLRQEAARLGGIGSCGRELCCSTWLTDFRAVNTSAARYQQLSLNPQKLAGQCGKLKCCLNYELDSYLEAIKEFPDFNQVLKTKAGDGILQKVDIFRRRLWYAYTHNLSHWHGISLDTVRKTLDDNKRNIMPESLEILVDQPATELLPELTKPIDLISDKKLISEKETPEKRKSTKKKSRKVSKKPKK